MALDPTRTEKISIEHIGHMWVRCRRKAKQGHLQTHIPLINEIETKAKSWSYLCVIIVSAYLLRA